MDRTHNVNAQADLQLENHFQELFKRVSDGEVERNPALCRQTERLRRTLTQISNPNANVTVSSKPHRSIYSIAGEYALLK